MMVLDLTVNAHTDLCPFEDKNGGGAFAQCRPRLRSQKKVNNIQLFFTKLTGVHLMCQIFMNDLLTEQGQQRSRVIR